MNAAVEHAYKIFNKMNPGDRIRVSEFAPSNPDLFIQCGKDYIDEGGMLEFTHDYSEIKKLNSIPTDDQIHYYIEFHTV